MRIRFSLLFALDREEKRHIVGDAYCMRLLKLIFLVLSLAGFLREADAYESQGEERFLQPPAAVHIKEDADVPKKDPSHSEQYHLVQRLVKRKLDASAFSFTTQNVPPSTNGRLFGFPYCPCILGEDDVIALYRFLRVYRC